MLDNVFLPRFHFAIDLLDHIIHPAEILGSTGRNFKMDSFYCSLSIISKVGIDKKTGGLALLLIQFHTHMQTYNRQVKQRPYHS